MSDIKDLSAIQSAVNVSKTTNKFAFIVVIYDPTMTAKVKYRTFFATRADHTGTVLEVQGYDVTEKSEQIVVKLKQTNKYDDAAEIAKTASDGFEIIQLPWHVVTSIKKLTFNIK